MRRILWTLPLSLLGLALLAPLASVALARTPDKATGPSLAVIQAPVATMGSSDDKGPFDATDCKACHEVSVTKMQQTRHG